MSKALSSGEGWVRPSRKVLENTENLQQNATIVEGITLAPALTGWRAHGLW